MNHWASKYLVHNDTVEELKTLQENLEDETISYQMAARALKWIIEDIEKEVVSDD